MFQSKLHTRGNFSRDTNNYRVVQDLQGMYLQTLQIHSVQAKVPPTSDPITPTKCSRRGLLFRASGLGLEGAGCNAAAVDQLPYHTLPNLKHKAAAKFRGFSK